MGKMIKPMVVVLLLLSIVALILGSMLYAKREVRKGRTIRLENGMEKVAKSIHYETFNKQSLIVDKKTDLQKMDKPIKDLALAGDLLYDDLQNTKEDLEQTTQELATIKNDLTQAQEDLASTKQEVKSLEGELDTTRTELTELRPMIQQLESEKEALQVTIDDQETKISQDNDKILDLNDQISNLDQEVEDLRAELGTDGGMVTPKGLTGAIVAVNPYWNFVVLDIGTRSSLVAGTSMLVHRNDQLIGKVRVSNVKEDMAIAEIVNDWEQSPIREGDNVLF